MAALVTEARDGGEPYCRHRVFDRNLIFYTRARYEDMVTLDVARDFLRSGERVLCVLRAEDAARLERDGLALRRLGSVSFLNTGGLTLRALIDPDPERELTEGGAGRKPLACREYLARVEDAVRVERLLQAPHEGRSPRPTAPGAGYGCLVKPMPCSPLMEPSSATTASNRRRSAVCARAICAGSSGSTSTLT